MRQKTDWTGDLPRLVALTRLVSSTDPDGPPRLRLVYSDAPLPPPRRPAFLAGSFNPPHEAHLAMARAARAVGADRVVFTLSRRTVDKAVVTGLGLADRLHLLGRLAGELAAEAGEAGRDAFAVALVNRGLYVDEAEAFHAAWPDLEGLSAVLGFDKIVQIFDPRYYADRDAALERLFSLATLLVAPRGGADADDLARLLDRPENCRFAAGVRLLPIAPSLADLSSSQLRESRGVGDLPPSVAEFLARTHAFAGPERRPDGESVDAYAVRLALFSALADAPLADAPGALIDLALADSPAGRSLRERLACPAGDLAAALREILAAAGCWS